MLRAAFRGTDTGGYAGRAATGRAATGRAVEEWVVTIMHFDGDRGVREWAGADKLGLFIQLGVIDNPRPSQDAWEQLGPPCWQEGREPAGAVTDGGSGPRCPVLGAAISRQARLPWPVSRRCPALTPAGRPMVEAVAFARRAPLLAGHAGACEDANGAVARRLSVSRHTASTHLRHIFATLGIPDRVALAAVAHHSIK